MAGYSPRRNKAIIDVWRILYKDPQPNLTIKMRQDESVEALKNAIATNVFLGKPDPGPLKKFKGR